jgi:hypothetical protein
VNANANGPRVCTHKAHSRRSHSRSQPAGPRTSRQPCDGRLTPWADPVVGTLGWQAHTTSRRLAVALAGDCRTVRLHGKREWLARIPQPALTITVISADDSTLWCSLGNRLDSGVLTVTFTPWTVGSILKCPLSTLPARGTLSVRDIRIKTRMGRTVRYLIPEFNPP